MNRTFRSLINDETGQDLIEYALLAALVATLSITALSLLGMEVGKFFTRLNGAFPPA